MSIYNLNKYFVSPYGNVDALFVKVCSESCSTVDPTPGLSLPSKKLLAQRIAPPMSVPLFRTSLLRSTQVLHGSVRNVSRTLGTVNNLLVRVVLPSHSALLRSRKFM